MPGAFSAVSGHLRCIWRRRTPKSLVRFLVFHPVISAVFLSDTLVLLIQELASMLQALITAINATTLAVNARDDTEIDRLQDVLVCIQEIALHGVRHGATITLACVESRSEANLS
jgi:hypothetical protein